MWVTALVLGLTIGVVVVLVQRDGSTTAGSVHPGKLAAAAVFSPGLAAPVGRVSGTAGPVDWVLARSGQVSLLYFGYTHCPDICPLNMASVSEALARLPLRDRSRVRVVFATVDPARDTCSVLRAWLAKFDSAFLGAVPTAAQLRGALGRMDLPLPQKEPDGATYGMSHIGGVFVFTPDGLAHAMFSAGDSPGAIAHDLKVLLGGWKDSYS